MSQALRDPSSERRPSVVRQLFADTVYPFRMRLLWSSVYLVSVLGFGTVGFRYFEGWELIDAVYMTVITMTAVGFMEVHPLSDAGRVFTMFLLGASIVGLGICWALLTAFIVEIDLGGLLGKYRMSKRTDDLKDHYIVCGLGRMGCMVVDEVFATGGNCVVIESSPEREAVIAGLRTRHPEVLIIEGDATKEQTLLEARIDTATGLATCLRDDAENLLLCLTARGLRSKIQIVARAYDEESLDKLRRAGANHAISPTVTGAVRMASALLRPSIVSFLDAATMGTDISLRLEQTTIPASSALVGQTLADARIPQQTGLVVLALKNAGESQARYNPGPTTPLQAGDTMIVLGAEQQIEALCTHISG